jgi:hypothetical protein
LRSKEPSMVAHEVRHDRDIEVLGT